MMATQKRCIALRAVLAAWAAMLAPALAHAGSVTATADAFVTVLDPMRLTPVADLTVASAIRPSSGAIGADITPASYDVIAPPGETFSVESSRTLRFLQGDGPGVLEAELDAARSEHAPRAAGPYLVVHHFEFGGRMPVSAKAETGFYSGSVSVMVNYN
ncbi:MAG: hypothetical protein JWQ29_83 [Phenylobacterium sp.]|jgi:hypothetical protein|nr:hypothetical protein [Phenylobacterium sp.]